MINISKLINISQYSNYNITEEGNEYLEWNDILTYYIRLCQFIGISTLYISFLAFGTYSIHSYYKKLYEHIIDDDDRIVNEKNKTLIPYEMKWFEEFDEEDEDSEDEKDNEGEETEPYKKAKVELTENFVNNLSLKTVTETTPRGDVLMYYSSKLNSFVYHSKTKEIPYKYLETVARKYVIEYKCKSLYIDIGKRV